MKVLVRFVQHGRCRELSCSDARHRAEDNARRSGEISPTVKSSTVKGLEELTLKVRHETEPYRDWTAWSDG